MSLHEPTIPDLLQAVAELKERERDAAEVELQKAAVLDSLQNDQINDATEQLKRVNLLRRREIERLEDEAARLRAHIEEHEGEDV